MGKVSWMDKRTNEQVLSSMNEKKSLIKTTLDRKKNWIGHVVRGDGLMKLVLERRMEGNRPSRRPRMGLIDDVLDETYGDMKRKAENRELENLEAKDLPLGRELKMTFCPPTFVLLHFIRQHFVPYV